MLPHIVSIFNIALDLVSFFIVESNQACGPNEFNRNKE